jgi:hypothetical protein
MNEEELGDSSGDEVRQSPYQFSLASLLLLPLWVAICATAYASLGKAAVPGIMGVFSALIACWFTKYRCRKNNIAIVCSSFFVTLLGMFLIIITASDDPSDDWLYDNSIYHWIVLSLSSSMSFSLIFGWYYL